MILRTISLGRHSRFAPSQTLSGRSDAYSCSLSVTGQIAQLVNGVPVAEPLEPLLSHYLLHLLQPLGRTTQMPKLPEVSQLHLPEQHPRKVARWKIVLVSTTINGSANASQAKSSEVYPISLSARIRCWGYQIQLVSLLTFIRHSRSLLL